MSSQTRYIKCPRCELNYIKEEEGFCTVCKSEMENKFVEDEEFEEDKDSILCPICKINYISVNEGMCSQCKSEQKQTLKGDDGVWTTYIPDEDEEFEIDGDEEVVSLSKIVEEEDEEYIDNPLTQEDLLDIFEQSSD